MRITTLNELVVDGKRQKGRWKLGRNGDLSYSVAGKEEETRIKAPLVSAEPDALVASVTARQSDQKITTTMIRLSGAWRTDARNRLVFDVERESGVKDELTFQGAWELSGRQEIVYRLRRTALKTRTKNERTLIFRGFWDLSEKHRLTYSLSGASESAFRFRGTFQTKSILAKTGEIRYQIGIEAEGRRRLRTVTLFGKWLVSKDLGISFESEAGDGIRRTMLFGGEFRLDARGRISVALKHRGGSPLGVELVLTRDLFEGNGNVSIRLQKNLQESRIETGAKIAW